MMPKEGPPLAVLLLLLPPRVGDLSREAEVKRAAVLPVLPVDQDLPVVGPCIADVLADLPSGVGPADPNTKR